MAKKVFKCETCGKEYAGRSGLYKHQKKLGHGRFAQSEETLEETREDTHSPAGGEALNSPPQSSPSTPPAEDSSPDWFEWSFDEPEATDTIPSPLKSIVASPQMSNSKLSKAQREALEKQNHALLKMGLTFIDLALTKYGSRVSEDPNFVVAHDEKTKELVASAQYRYLEEKGVFLTNHLSSGMIAASLTAFYIGSPIVRIRKHAKRRFFKTRILSRLPLIGRFFKSKEVETTEIGQNVEAVV
jgi:hypothetical protein